MYGTHDTRWKIPTYKAQVNRTDVLALADKFRRMGKYKKAVAEYRRLLAVDAVDADAHSKMAPLLVKLRQHEDALKSFRAAAEGFVGRGFVDRAIAMYSQAAATYPQDSSLWEQLGQLNHQRGRRAEAIKVLILGASHVGQSDRTQAEKLLTQALSYDPRHVDATVDLCRVLKRNGRGSEAKKLLETLAEDIHGPAKARLRAAQFKLFPGFKSFFGWVRA